MTEKTGDAFIDALTSFAKTVSELERIKARTEELEVRIASLQQRQYVYAAALEQFHASIMDNAEDPMDDFETAMEKARRSEITETRFDDAMQRLNFELRDSAKCGVVEVRSY